MKNTLNVCPTEYRLKLLRQLMNFVAISNGKRSILAAAHSSNYPVYFHDFEHGTHIQHDVKEWYQDASYLFPEAGHLYQKLALVVGHDRGVQKLYFLLLVIPSHVKFLLWICIQVGFY